MQTLKTISELIEKNQKALMEYSELFGIPLYRLLHYDITKSFIELLDNSDTAIDYGLCVKSFDDDLEDEREENPEINPWFQCWYYFNVDIIDGVLSSSLMSCDADGDHDFCESWPMGDDETFTNGLHAEIDEKEQEYALWVIENGIDPLNEYTFNLREKKDFEITVSRVDETNKATVTASPWHDAIKDYAGIDENGGVSKSYTWAEITDAMAIDFHVPSHTYKESLYIDRDADTVKNEVIRAATAYLHRSKKS